MWSVLLALLIQLVQKEFTMKNKTSMYLVAGTMALVGLALGTATVMASAQTSTINTTPAQVSQAVVNASGTVKDTPESPNDPADTDTDTKTHGHAPLGGDGVVLSVTGSTIVVSEESDEGGASYTVDASKATVTNNGASASLSDIKVGAKIFVEGSVSGTSVVATSVSLGHHGHGGEKEANDTDGGSASEANEAPSASDAGDQ